MKIKKILEEAYGIIDKKGKKKVIENAVIVIIIGIIIIIASGSFFKSEKKENNENNAIKNSVDEKTIEASSEPKAVNENVDLEKKIEEILSKIDGAGQVEVMITYVSGKEVVHAYDIKNNDNKTQERDSGGGSRDIEEKSMENTIVFEENTDKSKKAIVVKELFPEVKGVIVVADGAKNNIVKEDLYKAVQALLDVPAHRIQVFERRK